jgi:hypothetical protein
MPRFAMAFGFRIRFELVDTDRVDIDQESVELVATEGGATVTLTSGAMGQPIKSLRRLVLAGKPFPTLEDAKVAAHHYRERLLAMATRRRLAMDLGDGFVRSAFTPEGALNFEMQYGKKARPDVHGIDVYELSPDGGKTAFVHFTHESALTISGDVLVTMFRESLGDPRPFEGNESLAAEIFALGRFIPSFRARFLTLMSGIEALIETAPRSQELVEMVEAFRERVGALPDRTADAATKTAIVSALQWLKRESIGQAGRRLAQEVDDKQYLGKPAVKFFKDIYALRSEILHTGATRSSDVDLLAVANATSDFLADVLRARIERRTGRKGEVPRVVEAIGGYVDSGGRGVTVAMPYKSPERPKP